MLQRCRHALLAVGLLVVVSLVPAPSSRTASATGVPFSSMTLSYQDSRGPGAITFTNQGSDAATGGSLLGVTLTQDGKTLRGQGFAQQTQAYAMAFWLSDGTGGTYFFTGVLSLALGRWSGKGSWQDVQAPQRTDQWTMT